MTLVRILVDGCGLLKQWPELALGKPRQSQSAREELIHTLTQYHDAEGIPITVVFEEIDGLDLEPDLDTTEDVEVHFRRSGQKVRPVLERLATQSEAMGAVMIVADVFAETPPPVSSCLLKTCKEFVEITKKSLADLEREIEQLNLRENQQFSHLG